MMQHNQIYEQLAPGRLFARCAFPSMVSMAVTSLYTVADGIFVGRMIAGRQRLGYVLRDGRRPRQRVVPPELKK